jgi:hypothetical protein
MATIGGSNAVRSGLVLSLDAANARSYVSGSTTWRDMAGSGYVGTLTNGPTFNSDNYGSIVLDGTNDFINSPVYSVSASFSFYTGSFSLEATVKPTAYQTSSFFGLTNMIIAKGPSATFNYAMQLNSDTSLSFIKRGSAESLQYMTFTVPSLINKISNLVVTINPTGTTATCYVNGNLIGSVAVTGAPIEPHPTNDTLRFGGIGPGSTTPTQFIGNIYNTKIYNKTLSAEEILQNFNATKGRFNL